MVTYRVKKMIPTYLPAIGHFLDTMIVASIDLKSGNNEPSKSTSWKVLETLNSRRCHIYIFLDFLARATFNYLLIDNFI